MSPYPRTIAEFTAAGRRVAVQCGRCNHTRFEDAETLLLTFGTDFDLYTGLGELTAQLYCAVCGAGRPNVYFVNSARPSPFEPVSFDDAVASAVEFAAYVEARDGKGPTPAGQGATAPEAVAMVLPTLKPTTLIVLMAFDRGEDGELHPAFDPREMQSEDRAIRLGREMATLHAGVIAWTRSAKPDMGEFGEPGVFFERGDVPELE